MLPVLFNFGALKIYTFGVFLMLAFFWGSFLLWKNIRLSSFKEENVFDGLFLSLFGGILFGRLVYVILNFNDFGFSLLRFILINGYPGISIIGAIFGAMIILYLFFTSKKIKFIEIIDYYITPLFIAIAFGKFGSFFSGVEVGEKTKFFLKTRYFGFEGFRHLTPFYEAIFFAIGGYLSYRILFEIRKERFQQGFLLYFFVWFFSLTYFLFDKMKVSTLYLQGVSFNRMTAIILLLTTSGYFLYYFRSLILGFINKYGQKTIKGFDFRFKKRTPQGKGKES